MKENPNVHSILNKLLDEKLKQYLSEGEVQKDKQLESSKVKRNVNHVSSQVIKSPSDTTIYAPALQRQMNSIGTNEGNKTCFIPTQDQISDFVGTVRKQTAGVAGGGDDEQMAVHRLKEGDGNPNTLAKKKADECILDAEKYKATLATPPGNSFDSMNIENVQQEFSRLGCMEVVENLRQDVDTSLAQAQMTQPILNIGSGVSDDDFFHLTCHIEPSLIHKIEKGEFVELEKLLPKDRTSFGKGGGTDENRLEWVQRDGSTYLVAAGKDNKITGIRRWEQAFRAYATIYCAANPQRSKEIWQYISVINTAASAYSWDNVYNYDITFRHLMAFNPNRSWAVTYNQMWNLSMRDPLPRNHSKGGFQFHYNNKNSNKGHSGNDHHNGNNNFQRKRSDYCWNFNKGLKCKFGNKCKFIERCKYCDSPNHGINACDKLDKKNNSNPDTSNATHQNK